jgi:prepilin peptidase CpaA
LLLVHLLMNIEPTFATIAAVTIAVVAGAWDLRTRRIPNLLTFGAALAALAVHAYAGGFAGAWMSVAGWLVGAAFFLPFFALGGMGGGDAKLLAALGAWLGPAAIVWVALYSSLAGGVMALVVGAFSGYLRQAFTNIWSLLIEWYTAGVRPVPEMTLASNRGPRLAYAVPVLAGLMVTLWLQ